jgi:cation transport regulator ChaC
MKTAPRTMSDETGKELDDHLIVSVERPGYMIRLPNGDVTNRAIFEIEPDSEYKVLKSLTYELMIVPTELVEMSKVKVVHG